MLEEEGVSKVLPGILATAEGVQVYRRFYSEADELTHGALALHVSGSSVLNQPTRVMEMLLSELNVEGLRVVLGLRRTAGSNLDLLPPARSTLLSSFSKLVEDTRPASQDESKNVKSRLTVGARALAKHASRSSSGWWGVFTGTEALKNQQALSVVCNLLDNATWINVHHIPPAFPTFVPSILFIICSLPWLEVLEELDLAVTTRESGGDSELPPDRRSHTILKLAQHMWRRDRV